MNRDSHEWPRQNDSFALPFVRLGWMLLGPMLASVLALLIVIDGSGWATRLDLCFLLVVVAMISFRWISFLCGDLTDEFGEPTTSLHSLLRYTLWRIPTAAVVWVAANLVGNHLLH